MTILAGLPVLALTVILQSTVFSRVALLEGTVDLVLLVVAGWSLNERVRDEWVWAVIAGGLVGFISAIPFWVPLVNYLLVTGLAVYLKRRVWQIPVLALFVTVFIGSILVNLVSLAVLTALQVPLPLLDAVNLIILPGTLLNLLAALPVNGLVSELAAWLYPQELES